MWIKICANTSLEDARLAADLGAHAVGFVFARSPRHVSPAQVSAISPHLPSHVERIGVFDSNCPGEIIPASDEAALTAVQLHGTLDLELIQTLRRELDPSIALIQALHWDTSPGAPSPAESLRRQLRQIRTETAIERVLIDSNAGAVSGGTGTPFNWNAAIGVLREELGELHLIVAGGLRPDNVEEAIWKLCPWGVDVATGVEASPGKKDPQKLEAFIRKASRSTNAGVDPA